MSAKTLPGALKTKPVANTVPRVDTEPIYTQLKAAVGEQWGEYKTALSAFMMGMADSTASKISDTSVHYLLRVVALAQYLC